VNKGFHFWLQARQGKWLGQLETKILLFQLLTRQRVTCPDKYSLSIFSMWSMIPVCVSYDVIKYVVINYKLNNSNKNGLKCFLPHQCQLVCQDRHKNWSIQIDANVMNNAKMEHHINFDKLAKHDNLLALRWKNPFSYNNKLLTIKRNVRPWKHSIEIDTKMRSIVKFEFLDKLKY
jgi:hypothetical protein